MTPPRPPLSAPERRSRFLLIGAGSLLLALLVVWPLPKKVPFFPPGGICLFHQATGLPCALCGGTRAARCLVRQDWRGAWYYNSLIYALAPGAALLGVILLAEAACGKELLRRPSRRKALPLAIGIALLLLAWWAWHVYDAVTTPKPELADFRRRVVRALHANLGK